MSDLISRQDAIETSLEFFVEFLGGAFYENAQKELIARFQGLSSAQSEPQWIPVSERLPEKPEQVLIYAWNVHYVLAKYREIRTWEGIYKMAWVMEDAYNAPYEIKHDVIAWMPLPKPYAERREE